LNQLKISPWTRISKLTTPFGIDSYTLIFNPLQKTIKIFQEEQLHYGNFYAQWLKCKICTQKIIKDATQPLTKQIGEKILESFSKRTNTLMRNDSLVACLYLDPRFHYTISAIERNEAVKYLKSLWDRITEVNQGVVAGFTTNSTSYQSNVEFYDIEDELLNEYLTKDIEVKASSTTDVHAKIENLQLSFVRSDADILQFWKEKQLTDPELYALSKVCFAIPPTQVCTCLTILLFKVYFLIVIYYS